LRKVADAEARPVFRNREVPGPYQWLRRTSVTASMTAGLAVLVIPLLFWVGSMARTRTEVSSPG